MARHRFAIDEARDSARKWIAQGFSWAHENEENYYSYEEMQAIHDAEIAAEEAYVRLSEMGYFHPQAHAEAMEDLRRHEEEFPNGYCG